MQMQIFKVWFQKPGFFAHGGALGHDFLKAIGKLPDPKKLEATHVYLKDVEAPDLKDVYYQMQSEVWSPNGEAREFILNKGLLHTSMSVGDIAVWELFNRTYMVDLVGWVQLHG